MDLIGIGILESTRFNKDYFEFMDTCTGFGNPDSASENNWVLLNQCKRLDKALKLE